MIDDPLACFIEALASLNNTMTPLIEAVTGYKNKLTDQGFSTEVAEAMCIEYHRLIIRQIRGSDG